MHVHSLNIATSLVLSPPIVNHVFCPTSDDWNFYDFNQDPQAADIFLQGFDAGNTSVAHKQNRALLFDSMLFHQSDPFRFKKGE